MKLINYIAAVFVGSIMLASCEKHDYPAGLHEYDHHYYLAYLPNNNTAVVVQRTQAALLKFPVQFYSAFIRDYDAVTYYSIAPPATGDPAVLGQDFAITDANGTPIEAVDGKYSMTFPQARKVVDTIYVKLLNSSITGTRKMEVQIGTNLTEQYAVDNFSTAFTRPVEIR